MEVVEVVVEVVEHHPLVMPEVLEPAALKKASSEVGAAVEGWVIPREVEERNL